MLPLFLLVVTAPPADAKPLPAPPAGFPKFAMQEFATDLKIGYAVVTADVNGDTKPDIVVVDQHRVVWYENPTWKPRVMLQGKTAPDNVCIAAADIDGGGDLEFVIGAGWKPFDTQKPGTLQWLKRGKTLDEEWTMHAIPCDEPTVHRVQMIDIDGDTKPELVLVPLMGRGATAKANWMDGRPVRVLVYRVPAEPAVPRNWQSTVLSEELHVVHNFAAYTPAGSKKPMSILTASYEGYSAIILDPENGKHRTQRVHEGNRSNPAGNLGASEIRSGWFRRGSGSVDRGAGAVVATIEPWHGNQVVAYTGKVGQKPARTVVDDRLRWGHAIAFADLDQDGSDELIIGVRDDPNPKLGDKFQERRGVRLYRCGDDRGEKWDRYILEDGGVAVEDLCATDLDSDGRLDIIAVGRATKNGRIYWNLGS
jgi:hypothetical protein